ncbi:calmodulin-like protein 4 [Lingula anatina]|uniref:Calmodulin-like protein 4 n=1 Tax=Lingula anatina TaxID=7574 RepID=A0A1S3H3H9_LINAN|nr:calmodulin-like protein 4 [Lingula anatina]|eukprot:XP_013380563.1 calmodulin-like protein 4 [Lingula anatina]
MTFTTVLVFSIACLTTTTVNEIYADCDANSRYDEEEEYADAKAVFDGVDLNRDNRITKDEFLEAIKERGIDLAQIDVDGEFDKMDENKDGVVEPGEFDHDLQ